MIKRLFYKDSFKNSEKEVLLRENMNRIRVFSFVIMILECLFLVLSFVMPEIYAPDRLLIYRKHYLFLLIGSGLVYMMALYFQKHEKYHLIYEVMVYVALFAAILWGASISILDLMSNISMTVYLTFLFIASFVIIVRPDITMVALAGIQTLFVLLIPESPMKFSYQLNSSIFVLFAWFVGRYQYYLITERIKKDAIIEEKNYVLEKKNQELAHLMMMDHLTGVYNRYSLDDILAKKWIEAYIHQHKIIVLMIDIDDFKPFNDKYGHIIGDECLKLISQVLKEVSKRHGGFPFRYGGDEFCLIFSNIDYIDNVIEEIYDAVEDLNFEVHGENIKLRLSIGKYEEIPKTAADEWRSIEEADRALYRMKAKRKRRKTDI